LARGGNTHLAGASDPRAFKDTSFNFTKAMAIGALIDEADEQLIFSKDNNPN
jgi:hypothetical protein